MTDPARLRAALSDRISAVHAAGRAPIAVLDVDLTLVDNAPRTRAIFADFAHAVRARWPDADAAVLRAATLPLVFSAAHNLRALGVPEPLLREGLAYWWARFFTARYAMFDVPLPGAVDAVHALRAQDVTVAYLTARPSDMADGTVTRFRELGLPVAEPGTLLVMRPDREQADGDFKRDALDWLAVLGAPVLCVDNEPAHVNLMRARFPDALTVLADTRHHPDAPPLADGIPRVADLSALVAPRSPQ